LKEEWIPVRHETEDEVVVHYHLLISTTPSECKYSHSKINFATQKPLPASSGRKYCMCYIHVFYYYKKSKHENFSSLKEEYPRHEGEVVVHYHLLKSTTPSEYQ
jgi:hypothetical protein